MRDLADPQTRRVGGRQRDAVAQSRNRFEEARNLVGVQNRRQLLRLSIVLTTLEAWIRRRLRMYLWRQWQNGQNRFKELRRRGVSKFHAAVAAGSPTGFWRMSGHPAVQQALRNEYFDSLGLPRIHVPAQA
jgi:RNA-directed DNA polymerase